MKDKVADSIAVLAVVGLVAVGLLTNLTEKQTGEVFYKQDAEGQGQAQGTTPGKGKGKGPLDALQLTPEQKAEFSDLNDPATIEQNRARMADMQAKTRLLEMTILRPETTRADVNGIIKEIAAIQKQMISQRVDRFFETKKILSPKQLEKLMKMDEQMIAGNFRQRMPQTAVGPVNKEPDDRAAKK